MKALVWIGLVALVAGVLLLFIPLPHRESHGIQVGDAKLGVTVTDEHKAPTIACVALIIGGAALAFAGRGK